MLYHYKYQHIYSFSLPLFVTFGLRFARRCPSPSLDSRRKPCERMTLAIPRFLGVCGALLIILFVPMAVMAAQEEDSSTSGWFGDIQAGGGVISSRPSGLEVFDDNDRLDSLTEEGSRQSEGFGLIGGEIGCAFKTSGTTLLVGGSMNDPLHISLGREVDGWGQLTLSALYKKGKVWKNPYLTEVDRDETDAESIGYSLAWDNILHIGLGVYFEQMHIDIKQDLIGQFQSDLQRDGIDTTLGLSYAWNLGTSGVLTAGVSYVRIDRDGGGNSGNGYAAQLNHVLEWRRFSFATDLELIATEFDEIHPVFNEKREEAGVSIFETISFAEPFGLDNFYLFGIAGYSATDADLTFFDSSSFIVATGVGYRF